MKHAQWILRILKTIGLILTIGGAMSACSSTMSWKEEVKLHDGQIAISERYYKLGGYHAIESRERAALNETVTFSLPGTNKKITWQTDFRDSQPEPNSLNLIRFDVVKGVPYIATYPAGCIAYNKWGRPNPPQVLFKYESEQWKRITLAELPAELINAQANVVVGRPATSLLRSYYTVKGVDDENYDIHEASYKTILREAVKNGSGVTTCEESYSDGKGGWLGVGWFKHSTQAECAKFCAREKISAEFCKCIISNKGE